MFLHLHISFCKLSAIEGDVMYLHFICFCKFISNWRYTYFDLLVWVDKYERKWICTVCKYFLYVKLSLTLWRYPSSSCFKSSIESCSQYIPPERFSILCQFPCIKQFHAQGVSNVCVNLCVCRPLCLLPSFHLFPDHCVV